MEWLERQLTRATASPESANPGYPYCGDVSPHTAFENISQGAIIVDVRTKAEWSFVGLPQIDPASLILCEWQEFPNMTVNPNFVAQVTAEIANRTGDAPLNEAPSAYFLCRSGVRSQAAAAALTQAGHPSCFNIATGFEGQPDQLGHRGTVNGWKADGLPWRQS